MKANILFKILEIMKIHEVRDLIVEWQKEGQKVVLATGTFEFYLAEHVNFIEQMKAYGDRLIIGISSDSFIQKRKKNIDRPFVNENDRVTILNSNRNIDCAFIAGQGKHDLVPILRPDIVIFNGTKTEQDYEEHQKYKLWDFQTKFPSIEFEYYHEPIKDMASSEKILVRKIKKTKYNN